MTTLTKNLATASGTDSAGGPARVHAAARWLAVAALACACTAISFAADPRLFFLKDIPSDELSGAVDVREALEPRVEVPVRCDAGWGQCFEKTRFRRVFGLSFRRERKRSAGDAVAVESEPLGTVHVAMSVKEDTAIRFRDILRDTLNGLDAYAFNRTLAGIDEQTAPLDMEHLGDWSDSPSWLCLETPDGRRRTLVYEVSWRKTGNQGESDGGTDGEDGERLKSVGATGMSAPEVTKPVCDGLQEAAASTLPRTVRTFASPLSKRLQTVFVEESDDLTEEVSGGDLASLPADAWIVRTPMPGVVSGGSAPRSEGGEVRAERFRDGEKVTASASDTDLTIQTLVAPGVVRRWSVANTFFTLGMNPSISNPSSQSFLTAYFPTGAIPELSEEDLEPERFPAALESAKAAPDTAGRIDLDHEAFDDTIGKELMRQSLVTLESLERAVIEGHAALTGEGGLLVFCREDGSATYFVAPVMAPGRIRNAGAVCPVLYSRMR